MSTSIQSLRSYTEPHTTPTHASPQAGDMFNQIGNHAEISQFVASPNVEMIWNIIIQNTAFHSAASVDDTRSKLRQHYITHLKQYIEICIRSNTKVPIIDLNKNFIAEFIRGFKETSPSVQKLDLSNTVPAGNGVITIEELKAERKSNFDNQYDKMKTDFDQYHIVDVGSDTKFTDNTVVEPIKNQDMDDMLSRMIQNRTEQENTAIPRSVHETEHARNWLNLGDSTSHTNKVIQPHPEREKRTVSFVTDTIIPQQETHPIIHSIPITTPQPSPIIALQTRMHAIETKIDEMYAMISGLVTTASITEIDVEENVIGVQVDTPTSIETQSEQTDLQSTPPL
jgi:hypothetical protein